MKFKEVIKSFWEYLRPPLEPCMFCGKLTRERNSFNHSIVRHQICRDKENEIQRTIDKEREQINLIKKAIKELEAEKLK